MNGIHQTHENYERNGWLGIQPLARRQHSLPP
jgi:hypothetical protein